MKQERDMYKSLRALDLYKELEARSETKFFLETL
jgi:hypothetical protein